MATLQDIVKERKFKNADRDMLRTFYRGECSEVQPVVFSRPKWMTEEKYAILMLYFAYVNLCKPAVNRIVSGVYGGPVNRVIADGSPQKAKVDRFIADETGYGLKCREWFKSAVLYGPGINVFLVDDDQVKTWQPNPIRTELVASETDVTDLEWVVEAIGEGDKQTFRFASKFGWGTADKDGEYQTFTPHGLGICPAVVAYGEDERMFGNVDGRGLVNSSVQYSIVVSRLLLNQVALIMNYVRPQAVAKGQILNPEEAFEADGVAEMEPGSDFLFVTPDTNFNDLSKTIDAYKSYFCISEGVPLDALDPSNIPENQSATSARLRNQPLSVTINRLVEEQKTNEIRALTIIGAIYHWLEKREAAGAAEADVVTIDFADFASKFNATVSMEPSGNPESYAEEVNAWKVLYDMGAKTPEDVVRHFNPNLSETEVRRRVKDIEAADEQARQTFERGQAPVNTIEPEGDPTADNEEAA